MPETTTNTGMTSGLSVFSGVTSLVGTLGGVANGFLSNKAKMIEADYKTEIQQLYNARDLTKAQFETKLAEINARRSTDLEQLKNERTKTTVIGVAVVVVVLGVLGTLIYVSLKKS
jgi:hypothetical protein